MNFKVFKNPQVESLRNSVRRTAYLGIESAENDHDDQALRRVDDDAGVGKPDGDLVEALQRPNDREEVLNGEDRRHGEDRFLCGVKMLGRQLIVEHTGDVDEQQSVYLQFCTMAKRRENKN